jgi:hypothetical protein
MNAEANVPVVTSSIKPQRIVQTVSAGTRTYFVDFGEAYFGSLSFSVTSAASAQSISVVSSEAASANDIATTQVGCRSATATETVGTGTKSFSEFTNQPFRAVRIKVPDPAVTLDTSKIVLVALHVPFNDSASLFTSSDTVLDRVWELCKHTVKATSFLGVYIDGARETKPYEGDTYINMLTHFASDSNPPIALYTYEYLLTHETWPWEYKIMNVMMGWNLYMQNGDLGQLQTNYAALQGKLQEDFSGSWSDSGAMVDWPTNMRDGYVFTKGNVVANAWVYEGLVTIANIADAIGKSSDAASYRARAAATLKKINDSLFVKAQGVYRDGLGTTHVGIHGNLFPLAFGIVPDSLKAGVCKYLKTRGMACNVYPAQFLLDGLFDAGEDEYAISLLDATTGNSWGHMLYQIGATMTMEVWDPSQKSNLDWEHAWGTAAGNVIPRKLFGINPLTPGYGKVVIKPQVGALTDGSYKLPTVKGTILVSFKSEKDKSIIITATVPVVTKFYVPTYSLGDNTVIVDGKQVVGTREGKFIYVDSIAPGSHTIERQVLVGTAAALKGPRYRAPLTFAIRNHGAEFGQSGSFVETGLFIKIIDCRGKLVRQMVINGKNKSRISLPTGAYTVITKSDGFNTCKRFNVP